MKVFCALMTMIGRSGRMPLDARQEFEGIVVGHQDVGDDEIAFARGDPPPQPRDRARRRTS